MPPSVVVLFVGDAEQALSVATALESRTSRDAHVLTADPGNAAETVGAAVDAVVVGSTLSEAATRTVLADLSAADAEVPAVLPPDRSPDADGVRTLTADPADPSAFAETLLGTLLEDGRLQHRGSDAHFAVDADWTVLDWDPALEERTGVGPAEALGTDLWDLIPEAVDTEVYDTYQRVMTDREPETDELYYEPLDYWLRCHVYPTAGGGIEVYSEDITAEKERASELAAARERLSATLERVTDGFLALDEAWEITYSNRRASEILDLPEDPVGEPFWDVLPEAAGTDLGEAFREAMRKQSARDLEEHYEPLDIWFEVTIYPASDGLSVFFQDVTERKTLATRLEAIQRTTRNLLVASTDTAVGDLVATLIEEELGFPLAAVWRYDAGPDRLVPLAATSSVGRIPTLARDRSDIWTVFDDDEISVREPAEPAIDRPDADAALYVALGEYGVLAVYDTSASFSETTVELFRLLGAAVESALARTDRERELARRTERLDDFASVVSHDLRNPLQVALTRAEMVDEDDEHREALLGALDRMDALIDELLDLARAEDEPDREPVSLAAVAREAWEVTNTARATLDVAGDAQLTADPGRLRQLFETLYRNAGEHAGPGAAVEVGVHEDGFYVADDGPGIPPEDRERVFERGYSGSPVGTGYGLAIVSDIVEGHGWTVRVTDSETGGARFEVGGVYSLTPAPGA